MLFVFKPLAGEEATGAGELNASYPVMRVHMHAMVFQCRQQFNIASGITGIHAICAKG